MPLFKSHTHRNHEFCKSVFFVSPGGGFIMMLYIRPQSETMQPIKWPRNLKQYVLSVFLEHNFFYIIIWGR